jgi:hypothetical protein
MKVEHALSTRVRGPMARRLTTNQEIAGSIPAVLIFLRFFGANLLPLFLDPAP